MASLIDEALADEPAFREKTARLFEAANLMTTAALVRFTDYEVRSSDTVAVRFVRRSVFGLIGGGANDVELLRHIEALDAAQWARGQLGR